MNPIVCTELVKARVADQAPPAEHRLVAHAARQSALARALLVIAFLLPVVTVGIMLFNMAHGASVTHAVAGGGNWGG
jgi:hypothetical protein